jgi:uncharacterized membrane protein
MKVFSGGEMFPGSAVLVFTWKRKLFSREQRKSTQITLLCCLGRTVVSVVQATESSVRNNTIPSCRTNSAARCFLIQSEVGAVLVIIADVLGKKSLQVVLVQSDHMVE